MTPLSIALVSLVLLALQIVLIQAIGYSQGHHLAYVVLSIALLGFGAGGAFLTLLRQRRGSPIDRLYAPSLLLCAWSTAWLSMPAVWLLNGFELELLFVSMEPWLRLAGLGAVLFIPFFSGAIALSIAFTLRSRHIGPLYAANLGGSAAGAAVALLLLRWLLPEQTLPLLALLSLLAALCAKPRAGSVWICALGIAAAALFSPPLPTNPYKALSAALRLPQATRTGPLPHPLGRLDRVDAPALRYAPDLSLRYQGPVPSPPHLFLDGEAAGVLLDHSDPAALILQHTPRGLPFIASPPGTALFLQPDGTPAILAALAGGWSPSVAEPHPRIAEALRQSLAQQPVKMLPGQPRRVLSQQVPESLDLIVFPPRGIFGGPLGLQALGEDSLFTVEALRDALRALRPGGALCFSAWLDEPLRHALRVVDLVATALREHGADSPADHLVILRGWNSICVLAGRDPLEPRVFETASALAAVQGFDRLWPPQQSPRLHTSTGQDPGDWFATLLGPEAKAFRENYAFDIRAPTDDRPFFNQFIRPGPAGTDIAQLSVSERGLHLLQRGTLGLGAAVIVLIFGPLIPLRGTALRPPFTLLYYSGLGAGFMLFEVLLIQRLMPLWGHAATSTAIVISALLVGMGGGSLISRRIPLCRFSPALACLACACWLAILLHWIDRLLASQLAAPFAWQTTALLLLLPLSAVPLGIPFPLGIRTLAQHHEQQIPWACGIDGAVSVMAAPTAALLAMAYGYSALTAAIPGAYLLSAVGALCLAVPTSRK